MRSDGYYVLTMPRRLDVSAVPSGNMDSSAGRSARGLILSSLLWRSYKKVQEIKKLINEKNVTLQESYKSKMLWVLCNT